MKLKHIKPNYFVILLSIGLLVMLAACSDELSSSAEQHLDHSVEIDNHADHNDREDDHSEHDDDGVIHLTPQALMEAGIVTEVLEARTLTSSLELPGALMPHPDGEGFVGSLVEGRIKEIFVDVGDHVSAGEALCIIESPAVGEVEAAYITALAELEFVKSDLERHKTLISEGIGSQKEQLELQSQLAAGSSALSAAERTLHAYGFTENDIEVLKSDQHTGGRVMLRSPLSGSVIIRDARLGMQISPETDLFHIVDLKRLRVRVDVPEQRIGDVNKGTEVTVISQNGHTREIKGKVERLGNNIELETRSLAVYVYVDNTAERLNPGAFVTVRFNVNKGGLKVLAVPLEAVFTDEHGDHAIFVEAEPGIFNVREVETGQRAGGRIQLKSGVTAGERVVIRGAFTIKSEANKSNLGDGHNH
ncbi:efflux RND transporter periplasmic adaptor subunit [Calditrichota bacterium]